MKTSSTSKYVKTSLLFTFSFLWISLVTGQYDDPRFQRYSVLDGLSQCYVNAIIQDHKGFIWVATNKGINRFDGYNFNIYMGGSNDSLGPHMISGMFEDSRNRLWVGSFSGNGNLFLYNRERDEFTAVFNASDFCISENDNRVYDIAEDQYGNIWLAAYDGLVRFNPNEKDPKLIIYTNKEGDPESLISNHTEYLTFDSRNRLWISTSAGLDLYDSENDRFIHFKYDADNPFSIGHNNIRQVTEDQFGTIWVGTRGGGLNKLVVKGSEIHNKDDVNFIRYMYDPLNPSGISNDIVTSFDIDNSGDMWITTDEGLNRITREQLFNTATGKQTHLEFSVYKNNPLDNESLNYNYVQSVFSDRSGTLWVGTSTGLNKEKSYKFRAYKQSFGENSLASNKIQAIFEDSQNNIWIGSSKGLNLFNKEDNTFKLILNGRVLSVCEDADGYIWIGQWQEGLIKYDPRTGKTRSFTSNNSDPASLGSNNIFTTYVDSRNNVWICTWGGGLNLYNRESDNFSRYVSNPEDNQSISGDYVCDILEDRQGELWIGTINGLSRMYNQSEGRFTNYRHNPNDQRSLSDDFIQCIYETGDGTLWIGTQAGLNKFNRFESNFTSYTRADGLLDDMVLGILEDDHQNLWLSTSKGLSKIVMSYIEELDVEEQTSGGYSVIQSSIINDPIRLFNKNFDVDDGLQSREFIARSCLKTYSGEMLFGGINGFNLFHPDSVKDNKIAPDIVFTDFQLFNRDIGIGEVINGDTILNRAISEVNEITLSHRNNVFSVEFTAMHFVAPGQNKYAYKLDGFEEHWNIDSDRKAAYTNLNPGEYFLRVNASNNDGFWAENDTVLKIIITPPFWKTWWFKILFISLVISLTMGIIELRLQTLKRQRKQLEEKVIERTTQVLKQKDQIEEQSMQIQQMNEVLRSHNIELEDNLHNLSEARVMQKLISFDEFRAIYSDENACCRFLEELKWKEGYTCKKCGSSEYSKEDDTLMRRCRKCNYKESVTCGTIFHRLRFPIDKAFYILILTSTGREINISQLSNTIDLRIKTCWEFHNKVKDIMQTRKRFKNPKEGWKELILLTKKKAKTSNQVNKLKAQ